MRLEGEEEKEENASIFPIEKMLLAALAVIVLLGFALWFYIGKSS
jgi:hypothetical protein